MPDFADMKVFAPTVGAWSWGLALMIPKTLELFGVQWALEAEHILALTAFIAGTTTFAFRVTGYKPKEVPSDDPEV